ncbi:MAG TPA: ATP-binding protein [Acidimicrobiales bacterium]|nr:ATP-binding protein [Acidimicrobiales bacterium]
MADVRDLRVLLVDDDEMQHRLVPRVLSRVGLTQVRSEARARSVPDAVVAFDPDLILLDMRLADGDGFGVLAALADRDPEWPRRHVVLVTGDTDPRVADRAVAMGAREVLIKPFGVTELVDLVTRVAGPGDLPAAPAPAAASAPAPVPEAARMGAADGAARSAGVGAADGANLVDVVTELASARSVDDVVRIVRTAARKLTGADGATFVLREGDHCHYVDEDAISPLWKGSRFPLATCISGWAMVHRQPVVVEDIYVDDRIPHDAYRPTFVKSLVMVPIRTAEPIGAIGNYWARHRLPTPEEVRVLQALADSTAVALQNARLYAQLDGAHEQTDELTTANDDLRQFVYAVAHDVRSPLQTISGFAELLAAGSEPDVAAAADAIRRAAGDLADYVSDLLAFATADARTLQAELLSLDQLVGEVVGRLEAVIRDRGANVVVEADARIVADRVLMEQVLQNLVANAIDYTPADRRPVVRIGATADDDWWDLRVSDNGDGVPVGERETIFEAFRRGSAGSGRPGSGLGLALCRRAAERHGGGITVGDGPDGGAEFVVRLSRRPVGR